MKFNKPVMPFVPTMQWTLSFYIELRSLQLFLHLVAGELRLLLAFDGVKV